MLHALDGALTLSIVYLFFVNMCVLTDIMSRVFENETCVNLFKHMLGKNTSKSINFRRLECSYCTTMCAEITVIGVVSCWYLLHVDKPYYFSPQITTLFVVFDNYNVYSFFLSNTNCRSESTTVDWQLVCTYFKIWRKTHSPLHSKLQWWSFECFKIYKSTSRTLSIF